MVGQSGVLSTNEYLMIWSRMVCIFNESILLFLDHGGFFWVRNCAKLIMIDISEYFTEYCMLMTMDPHSEFASMITIPLLCL
jgi:hypothetical protein